MSDTILFYDAKEPFYEFSNFYPAPIKIDGESYPTTEHYYQAQKFMGPDASPQDLEYAKLIKKASTPNKAFYLAKQNARGGHAAAWYLSKDDPRLLNGLIKESIVNNVQMRPDWEIVKDLIMRKALWAKFTQHSDLANTLIDTDNAYLAEDSPRDPYWGLGKDGDGQNMLGRILMEIRTFLSGQYPKAPTSKSNWIIPEFLLASAMPGSNTAVVDALMKSIGLVLSLQEDHEAQDWSIIAPNFTVPDGNFCVKVYSTRYKREIILMRVGIKDRSTISDAYLHALTDALIKAIGKHYPVLIHCLGGKGRTGTVIAVMLGKIYGMNADAALRVLKDSFATRKVKGKKPCMPQTAEQIAQVKRILTETKLAIVGSRNFTNYTVFKNFVQKSLKEWAIPISSIKYIVSGGAKGADSLAKQFAKEHKIKLIEFKADWDVLGKSAGPIRNKDIIGAATHVIAFPSVKGKGTQSSINFAKKAGLPIKILNIDEPEAAAATTNVKAVTDAPTVVCIKKDVLKSGGYSDLIHWLLNPNHLYIGRDMSFYVPGAKASKWKNPFSLKKYSLEEALQKYEEHIRNSPQLLAALPELSGKVLGCWCKPDGCHGDVLVKLFEENAQAPIKANLQVWIGKKAERGVGGAKDPVIKGVKNINVTSGSANKIDGKLAKEDLSPLLIGPVNVGAIPAQKFENYWQYGKVFPDLGHIDANGKLTKKWHDFRKKGYAKKSGDRHPEGTRSDVVKLVDDAGHKHYKYYTPKFAVYDLGDGDQQFDYLESRKKVYVPVYAELIRNTDSFKALKEMVDSGTPIQILDLDGPKDGSHLVTVELLREKINDLTTPFGHGYVVAALLADIEAEEYTS